MSPKIIGVPFSRVIGGILIGLLFMACALSTFLIGSEESRYSGMRGLALILSSGILVFGTGAILRARRRGLVELHETHLRDLSKGIDIPWRAIQRVLVQKGVAAFNPFHQWLTIYLRPRAGQSPDLPQMVVVKLPYASKKDFATVVHWIEERSGVTVEIDSIAPHHR